MLNINELYPWQIKDWNNLYKLNSKLPNSILFYGSHGIGKLHFAQYFVKWILCESQKKDLKPCNVCTACYYITLGQHPDYRIIFPEGMENQIGLSIIKSISSNKDKLKKNTIISRKEIKINQIYSLIDFTNTTSHRDKIKIIIIYLPELINNIAANALLKTLEEPNKNLIFLLISSNLDKVLPTILSRCYRFPLTRPTNNLAIQWLSKKNINNHNPLELLSYSNGSPLIAYNFIQTKEYIICNWMLSQLTNLQHFNVIICVEKLEKISISSILEWIQKWIYDLFMQKIVGKSLYFPKFSEIAKEFSQNMNLNFLIHFQKKVTLYKSLTELYSLNKKLILEDLFFCYKKIFIFNKQQNI